MYNYIVANITSPPENKTVSRGSDVTISCGYKWFTALRTEWFINGSVFTQEAILNSPLYQLNNPLSRTSVSLTVFSINGTTTFKCVVLSDPAKTSTLGTVTVIGTYVHARDGMIGTYIDTLPYQNTQDSDIDINAVFNVSMRMLCVQI